jgi:hypothetical protein
MLIVRQQINLIVEECARAAERGGPDAVRELKILESDEVPPKARKEKLP